MFRREGRDVSLTADGEKLKAHARDLLRLNDEAWRDLAVPEVSGTVRLGIPDDYAFYLPEIIRDFTGQYPAVDLRVQCDLSVALVELVRAGAIDVALVTRQPNSAYCARRRWNNTGCGRFCRVSAHAPVLFL